MKCDSVALTDSVKRPLFQRIQEGGIREGDVARTWVAGYAANLRKKYCVYVLPPQGTVEKGPQSNEAMRGTCLKPHNFNRTLGAQTASKQVLPSNESYESKTGCNCTLATVPWVPLSALCFSDQAKSAVNLWHMCSKLENIFRRNFCKCPFVQCPLFRISGLSTADSACL